jgi:hypothetical protein
MCATSRWFQGWESSPSERWNPLLLAAALSRQSEPKPAPNLPQNVRGKAAWKPYNRSNMQPAFSTPFPEPLPAAMPPLSGKPRHGVPSWNPALHPGQFFCNSRTAIGLQFRCSETVSGPVVAPNNGNPNNTYPLLNTRNQNCGADASAALHAETGKILSGDWVGTTVTGVLIRGFTVGGLTASGVAEGAAVGFAGRALYYGAKGLLMGATTGGACAISTGITSLYDNLTTTGMDY